MMGMDVQTILGVIFGVGGVGAITVLVTSYRRLRLGKIGDEESLIKRLYTESKRQEEGRLAAERREDEANAREDARRRWGNRWREQAWQYRLQLAQQGITPKDDPELWKEEQ